MTGAPSAAPRSGRSSWWPPARCVPSLPGLLVDGICDLPFQAPDHHHTPFVRFVQVLLYPSAIIRGEASGPDHRQERAGRQQSGSGRPTKAISAGTTPSIVAGAVSAVGKPAASPGATKPLPTRASRSSSGSSTPASTPAQAACSCARRRLISNRSASASRTPSPSLTSPSSSEVSEGDVEVEHPHRTSEHLSAVSAPTPPGAVDIRPGRARDRHGLRPREIGARPESALVLGTVALQHDPDGVQDDPQVLTQPDPFDVLLVERHARVPLELVATMDLSMPRDPGRHRMPRELLCTETAQIVGRQRAGTDDAHVTAHDVPQARQLVQAGGPDEPTEAGQAVLVVASALRARMAHGAELPQGEDPSALGHAFLGEEDGPAHREEHPEGDHPHRDRCDHEAPEGEHRLDATPQAHVDELSTGQAHRAHPLDGSRDRAGVQVRSAVYHVPPRYAWSGRPVCRAVPLHPGCAASGPAWIL